MSVGMLAGGVFRPTGLVPAAAAPVAGTAAASAPANGQAFVARASADAADADAALVQTRLATAKVAELLTSAQGVAAQIRTLAAPVLARDPIAASPVPAQANLQNDVNELNGALDSAERTESAAETAARDAAGLPQTLAAVATESTAANGAAAGARSALAQVQAAAATVVALLSEAKTEVAAWQMVRNAPAGTLDAAVADPPSDWTVRGCEVVTARPGGAAATAGLVGRTQRTDPVGDVITSITDSGDGNTTWPIVDCAALDAAMAQTRVGDRLTIAYEHRHVIWYLLSGTWLLRTATVTLAAGASAGCPAPLTGSITPGISGHRIALTIEVDGPSGTKSVSVMLDTGGVNTTFPNALLQSLGYRPTGSGTVSGIVSGATSKVFYYQVPGSAITVDDHGVPVPVATGTLTVWGVVGTWDEALGPDILSHGAQFTAAHGRWALTPPCG